MDADALIAEFTRARPAPFVPEVRLHLADELVPLWQAVEWQAAAQQPPPFWAFAWPGSQALARYLFDQPAVVASRRVLDFGSGSGLAAIAAARCGAQTVIACDIDPLASAAQRANAALNAVPIEIRCADVVDTAVDVDVLLAGDVCYEREAAERTTGWLRRLAAEGTLVLLADPGRHYVPSDGLELIATYSVPTLHELESATEKRTRLWRLLAR